MRLKAKGQLAEDGMPMGAYSGVPMPVQVPPGMAPPGAAPMGQGGAPTVDMALPNPGLSQMAGQIGAQQQVAQTTAGPVPGQY